MDRRKKPPSDPTLADRLTIAILEVLCEHLPEVGAVRRTTIAGHLRDALHQIATSTSPLGRPPRYPPKLLCERYHALVRKPNGELYKRYKAQGIWDDTTTKWAADTERYLRAWWKRQR